MGIDVDALWDYDRPAVSEERFRAALVAASGDDALILRTQIARTFSLRKRCDEALAELDAIAAPLTTAGPEPRVRALLERGRSWRTAEKPADARPFFVAAFELADAAGLEVLAADALHMIPLVETKLDDQIACTRRLIAYARAARDPRAARWEGPGLHNLGVAYNEAGRHAEALATLQDAVTFREGQGKVGPIRIARWMVAHTFRLLGRIDDAWEIQRALEREFEEAGATEPYVFEELALLLEMKGDKEQSALYREKHRAATSG